ncbi:MAG: diphthamide biosynthesis enzyme Dph2 [Candidatus Caldarchaeum sp.]
MLVVNSYAVEVDEAIQRLREQNASKILIQSPLGLRSVAYKVGEILRNHGFEVIFSSSNCWGGCDVAYSEAMQVNVDTIIHIGHSRFLRRDIMPTIYLECRYADPSPIISIADKIANELEKFEIVGLAASVQWLDYLSTITELLRERGIKSLTEKPDMYSVYEGQVLGCDVSAMKKIEENVDAYLVLGSVFHGLGLAVSTLKPVYAADPHIQKVTNLEHQREKLLRQRFAQIAAFKKASKIGVLVSIKLGQKRMGLAKYLAKLLNSHEKEAFVATADEINPNTISENRFEGFVNTACPRLSLEDQLQFSKPVLLPVETLVALGLLDWVEVVEKGFLMYPWGWHSKEIGGKIWKQVVQLKI